MASSDVLNPTPTHHLNPDYGYARKRPITHLVSKANKGVPYFRDVTDIGHQFSLNWNLRPASHARDLKRYYEQYRDGYFTLIDHEGGGRQYAGRFSSDVQPIPVGHNQWTVQQVIFDEVPGATMQIYPNDWQHDAVWRLLVNDFGDRMAAVSGAWTLTANASAKSGYEMVSPGVAVGDAATYVYVGYGFQLWARTGPNMGIGALVIDGNVVGTIDFYSPAAGVAVELSSQANLVLGEHQVQLVVTNTKNAASSGYTIVWDALRVMR